MTQSAAAQQQRSQHCGHLTQHRSCNVMPTAHRNFALDQSQIVRSSYAARAPVKMSLSAATHLLRRAEMQWHFAWRRLGDGVQVVQDARRSVQARLPQELTQCPTAYTALIRVYVGF